MRIPKVGITLETGAALRRNLQHPKKRAAPSSGNKTREDAMPRPLLNTQTQHVAKTFLNQIAFRYPFHEALLFGLHARNTHTAQSDADIAIVV